jgi:hypothetical protein
VLGNMNCATLSRRCGQIVKAPVAVALEVFMKARYAMMFSALGVAAL